MWLHASLPIDVVHYTWGWLKLLLARVAACGAQREVNRLRKPSLQGLAPLDEVAAVSLADPCEFPARPLRFDKLVVMAGFVASGAGQPFALADVMPSQFSPHQSNG